MSGARLAWRSGGWALAVVLALVLASLARPAAAHESRPASLELRELDDERWTVAWKVPALAADRCLALDLRWPADVEQVRPPARVYAAGATHERSVLRRPGGLAGTPITVEGLARTSTDVLVRVERRDGTVEVGRLSPESPTWTPARTPGAAHPALGGVVRTYLGLGVEHIVTGVDHLLFVACLVLITGASRRLLTTITGFTLAHSLTLALVALDWVAVPVAPVEAAIALSLVVVAHELVVGDPDSLGLRHPGAMAAGFGLLHGFGFAAVLREVGLPPAEIPTGLLCFNLGVELGQLVFVAGLLGVGLGLGALARHAARPELVVHARRGAALVCGTIAGYWVVERVVGFW